MVSAGRERQNPALRAVVRVVRNGLFTVTGFSVLTNLLMLTSPIYMLLVYDKVLSSGQSATLLYLTLIAGLALLALGLLETVRLRLLGPGRCRSRTLPVAGTAADRRRKHPERHPDLGSADARSRQRARVPGQQSGHGLARCTLGALLRGCLGGAAPAARPAWPGIGDRVVRPGRSERPADAQNRSRPPRAQRWRAISASSSHCAMPKRSSRWGCSMPCARVGPTTRQRPFSDS